MIGPCPFLCTNKTSLGFCKTTGCSNPAYYKMVSNYTYNDNPSNVKCVDFFVNEDDEIEEH